MTLSNTVSQFAAQAAPVVGTLVLAVVGWLGAHAVAFIRARTKNTLVLGFMDRLTSEVNAAVAAAEQLVVTDLKAASGGKLSATDAAKIKADVLAQVQKNLGGDAWIAEAEKVIGVTDVEAFLSTRIEAAVAALAASSAQVIVPSVDHVALAQAVQAAVITTLESAAKKV
jgi:hypothetical protein